MIVQIVVAILNALGALLPQLPGLIDQLRGHPELNDGGKAALELLDGRLAEHERKLAAARPLPVPEPRPTPNERPTPPGGEG